MSSDDPRRMLPAVDVLLSHPRLTRAGKIVSSDVVTAVVRDVIAEARTAIEQGGRAPAHENLAEKAADVLESLTRPTLRRVINGTGVILHTGLGRAPLSAASAQALRDAAGYCNLEIDLESGERGERQTHVERLLRYLSTAEAALVVNNNAAALYLTLNVLAFRREVIVSRGQLIEIGGSFRLPDIMARSGAKLVEVGTTNRTRVMDYQQAVNPKTALLLRAHPSNYRIVGFTESVALEDMVRLSRECAAPVVDDLGNGLLWDWSGLGLPVESNVRASVAAGADLVLFSGDKILGGPQSGIIVGKKSLVDRLRKSALARVVRADKLTMAALGETLRGFLDRDHVSRVNPVWDMLTASAESLRLRAARIRDQLLTITEWRTLDIRDCESEAGSGSLPAYGIPSIAVCSLPAGLRASHWAKRLRTARTPVLATVREDLVWLDVRTVPTEDEDLLIASIQEALTSD